RSRSRRASRRRSRTSASCSRFRRFPVCGPGRRTFSLPACPVSGSRTGFSFSPPTQHSMLSFFLKRFSGRASRKWLKSCEPIVARINELEQSYQSLSEEELKSHTAKFRERFKAGETLDDLLPEAFA